MMSTRKQREAVDAMAAEQLQQLLEAELRCWIDDAWRVVLPCGPEAMIAAIAELVETAADKWPEQRSRLLEELQAMQQRLSE